MLLKTSIEMLMAKQNLGGLLCQQVIEELLSKDVNPVQAGAFMTLLRSKSETPEELFAIATTLKTKMIKVKTPHKLLDIVGTGGDRANTINISTGSAILAATCGIKIAKHGNRAVSSLTGSADVLEALGIKIDLSAEQVSACIDEVGIGFCYSQHFHPAIQDLRHYRKQLNVATTFNIIAPLLNPANPAHLLFGIYDESLLFTIAQVLQQLGTQHSLLVHGSGLDEISCVGPAKIIEVTPSHIKELDINYLDLGLSSCRLEDLKGGDAHTNAQILLATLSGKFSMRNKAIADTLILNAGIALYLYGLYSSIKDAIDHAKQNLESGNAIPLLKNWIDCSHAQ